MTKMFSLSATESNIFRLFLILDSLTHEWRRMWLFNNMARFFPPLAWLKMDPRNWLVTPALLFRFTDSIRTAAEEILEENMFYLWSAWHWYLLWGMSWFFNLSLGEEKLSGEMKDTWASVLWGPGHSFRIFELLRCLPNMSLILYLYY